MIKSWGIDKMSKYKEPLDIYDPSSNEDGFEIYDNTMSILSVIMFKMQLDYKKGLIKKNKDFETYFKKYYKLLQVGIDSDYMQLPIDWCIGRGNNCTGREDVGPKVGASSIEQRQEEHFCELLTVLDTKDRVNRFLALAKNSKKINSVANSVLTKFNTEHKYVEPTEYQEPSRNMNYISSSTSEVYEDLENTFGKFKCCATKTSLTLGDQKSTTIRKKNNSQNRVAFLGANTSISVVGLENNKRGNFVDFLIMLDNPMLLSKFDSNITDVISYFEGEDYISLLNSTYETLENLSASNYIKLFKLLEPIADYYHYTLKSDVYKKSGKELRDIYVTDFWNLYSISIGRTSMFKQEPDYLIAISGVSPIQREDATIAKAYYSLCKSFRDDTVERVEYYDGVSVG